MVLRDRLVRWLIQYIILPKVARIDDPGFIIAMFSKKKVFFYLRQLCLPEMLFFKIRK